MHFQSFRFNQLCLWTCLISVLPLFPRFQSIPWFPYYYESAIALLLTVIIFSFLCAYGINSVFVSKQYIRNYEHGQGTQLWLWQHKLRQIIAKKERTSDKKKARLLEKQEIRLTRRIEQADRPKKPTNPYTFLHYCIPFLIIYPVTFVNMAALAAFALALDKEKMRPERWVIGVLICIWGVITPCIYVEMTRLYCKQFCLKRFICVCSDSETSMQVVVDMDKVMDVDAEYFNQKFERDEVYIALRRYSSESNPNRYHQPHPRRDLYRTSSVV